MDMPFGVSKAVWLFSANIALVWFMFFSGYGLSLKMMKSDENLLRVWLKRLKKVYLPLLFVGIVCTIGYLLLPSPDTLEETTQMQVSTYIYYLHHLSWVGFSKLWPHVLGWKNWYVICIIFFYSFFYLSALLERKTRQSQTLWLFLLLVAYYVFAYFYFGKAEAHFYRYCWAFFLGHVVARWETYQNKQWPLLMAAVLTLTILPEGVVYYISYLIAILVLYFVSKLNLVYEAEGKAILFLGGISYFVYLIHGKLGFALMVYAGLDSIIAWALISTVLSWLTYKFYKLFANT